MRSFYLFLCLFFAGILSAQNPGGKTYFADVEVFNEPGPGQGVVRFLSCGDIDITSDLTMEAWVNLAIPTDNQKILGKVDADAGANFNDGYLLGVSNSRINPEVWTPNNQQFNEGFIPPVSTWHHIAVTYKTGGDYKAYLNGTLVYEQAAVGSMIFNDNTDFIIGIAPWDLANFMTFGYIDEVRLWSVERSQVEIRDFMFRNLLGNENGLVLYQNFDNDDGGTTIADLSSAGNDCTKNNMDETNIVDSECIIGSTTTQDGYYELSGLWFASNPFLQDPREVTTLHGLSMSANFNGQDTSAFVVWGHNDNFGTTTNDLPMDAPANAERAARTWHCTVYGSITPTLLINLNNTLSGVGSLPDDQPANYYTLLERIGNSGEFTAIQQANDITDGVVTFSFSPIKDAEYTIAVGDAPFDVSSVFEAPNYDLKASIFPNPNDGQFQLEILEAQFQKGQIQVFNSLGQLVLLDELIAPSQRITLQNAGWYVVVVKMGDQLFRQSVRVN